MKTLYSTSAVATGGREGSARSKDGALDVTLTTPKELGGGSGAGTNPEQLFAAGYAACFLSAAKLIAGQRKVTLPDEAAITATVGIGPNDKGEGYGLAVALTADFPGIERDEAQAIVDAAHAVCPYSNATRGNIDVTLSLA
ncbi:organic hydroperoxide resistance protein [Stakelama pacifica]|uniref:Ohr subfamily peroxiredoxin n=1 Tax=Stakelama pacifica TaxID=517720 RepID=A0A4V3BTQ8_9SPHN|nr:organic hydroperoxide resistance protein [Stakelama pacifica]MAW99700.1 organic hydroperoxide resistance protein [Sphingomonas sp.]TDN83608.1 Ohr subfamily peroxiredoxin [Stakelama pacifica]GGO94310.1 organic hydroperoxide resistance protein [Stakelama pacifica]